ncbi:MAG: type II secretion system protein [Patescibacteria group bacterium]
MVHCPIFLKKPASAPPSPKRLRRPSEASAGREGISFIELLIVLAFIGAMAVFLLVALNPTVQMGKARDSRRKSDLQKLKNPLEDYYNDHNCYPPSELMVCEPGTGLQPYWSKIPCDPLTKESYYYERPNCSTYRIYVKLEYEKDPVIAAVGCQNGCGPGGSTAYNYGISSTNVGLEKGSTPTPTPCVLRYACQQGWCQDVDPKVCPPKYCTSNCDGQCANEGGTDIGCP